MLELALAILALAVKAAPIVEAKIKAGEVPTDEQRSVREQYLAYRAAMDAALDGPEWQLSTAAPVDTAINGGP